MAYEEPAPGATAFEAACFAIERDAASDVLQLIWLQEWAGGVSR